MKFIPIEQTIVVNGTPLLDVVVNQTTESAYAEALAMMTQMDGEDAAPPATPTPAQAPKKKPEPPVVLRKPCLVHKEKIAQMSWGELRACTHSFCEWGTYIDGTTRRLKHSDKQEHAFDSLINDDEQVVEAEEELTVGISAPVRIAGEEEPDESLQNISDYFDDKDEVEDEVDVEAV